MGSSYESLKTNIKIENTLFDSSDSNMNDELIFVNDENKIEKSSEVYSNSDNFSSSELLSSYLKSVGYKSNENGCDAKVESDLVESARNGDSLAITLLVVKYHRFLDKYVGLLNVPLSYKEDFIQEGLIGLLKAVRTFDSSLGYSFSTYATRCIKNAVVSELRKHNRRGISKEVSFENYFENNLEVFDGTLESISSHAVSSPENDYIDRESSSQLHDTIFSVLSTYEAEVFEMYLAEIPYSQIAIRLGKDVKSIDNAIQRIKNKLKKLV